jgi:protease I
MSQYLKKILLIIPHDSFDDNEYKDIQLGLRDGGFETETASSHLSEAQGRFKLIVVPDVLINFVEAGDYNGFIFIGEEAASEYYASATILRILDHAHVAGKIVAAIGAAVPIIAYTGKMAGLKITGPEVERRRLEELGAFFTGNSVEISGNYITAVGPEARQEFIKAVVNILTWAPHEAERVFLR